MIDWNPFETFQCQLMSQFENVEIFDALHYAFRQKKNYEHVTPTRHHGYPGSQRKLVQAKQSGGVSSQNKLLLPI
jgi:hypothetical protein